MSKSCIRFAFLRSTLACETNRIHPKLAMFTCITSSVTSTFATMKFPPGGLHLNKSFANLIHCNMGTRGPSVTNTSLQALLYSLHVGHATFFKPCKWTRVFLTVHLNKRSDADLKIPVCASKLRRSTISISTTLPISSVPCFKVWRPISCGNSLKAFRHETPQGT